MVYYLREVINKKDMKKLSELESDLNTMISIYLNAKRHLDFCLYLGKPDSSEEVIVVKSELLLQEAEFAFAAMCTMYLNMILATHNHNFSINKLLNKMINNYKGSEWEGKISLELLQRWQSELKEEPLVSTIEKLKSLRDKYFAHFDKDRPDYLSLCITQPERERLIEYCETVLYGIQKEVLGKYGYLDISEDQRAKGILKRLTVYVKKQNNE